jgi:hypothetical protein
MIEGARVSRTRGSKNLFDQFHERGIGKGERDERDGDEEIHLEMEAGEFFINDFEFHRHHLFEALETLLENFAGHEFLLEFIFEHHVQNLFCSRLSSLTRCWMLPMAVSNVRANISAFSLPPRVCSNMLKASRGRV